MIDISNKIETLRTAIAQSRVIAKKETIDRAVKGDTPKGDVLNVARAAGVLAAKKTPELIPYCHPLALDSVKIDFQILPSPLMGDGQGGGDAGITKGHPPPNPLPSREGLKILNEIVVRAEVKTVGKTGVEMEALTAAMMAALTIYDMMKGIDKEVVIGETKLVEKHGGKSDYEESFPRPLSAAVLVTSDTVSAGKKDDKSGKIIVDEMKRFPLQLLHYEVVPDDKETIRKKVLGWTQEGIQLIVTTGGTGLGPRDVTVEAVSGLIEREVPGIAEAMRAFGQKRTPYAMLSRGVVGVRGNTLILTLPGSSKGVRESIAALFPNVLHLFNMMRGGGH